MGRRGLEHRGDEIRRPALDLVRGEGLTREERRALGLADHDLNLRAREADHLAGAGEGAPRAPAGHEEVEPLRGEVLQDLRSRGAAVIRGIRLVLELPREEPAVAPGELL